MNIRLGNSNNHNVTVNKGPCLNKDGLPLYTCLYGLTETEWHNLVVIKDDKYWLNETTYDSLQEAMESVTSSFTNWKTFWKTSGGSEVGLILKEKTNG